MAAIAGGDKRIATLTGEVVTPLEARTVERLRAFLAGSELNDQLFARAALAGLARNGEAADGALVRPWLESDDAQSREAAALALARVGTDDDVPKLLELSRPYGSDELFARVALGLSNVPENTAVLLLDASSAACALVGARYLFRYATELSGETLDLLLRHTTDDVRKVGVACVLERYDDDHELVELLREYTSANTYYYNVVMLLDRAMYAPTSFRDRTRAELRSHAEDTQALEKRTSPGYRRAVELFARMKAAGRPRS